MYKKYIKRILDFVFGIIFFILLLPLMLIIELIIYFDMGRKVIFKQPRIGKNKYIFKMYKFRTMRTRNKHKKKKSYLERTTKISRKIQSLGLDELPQLINIIKGEMSFIGPRPFIITEVLPSKPGDKIYEVKPGITGLAQVSGRRNIDHLQRLEYDYYYVDHLSFWLDVKIFFKTFIQIFHDNK